MPWDEGDVNILMGGGGTTGEYGWSSGCELLVTSEQSVTEVALVTGRCSPAVGKVVAEGMAINLEIYYEFWTVAKKLQITYCIWIHPHLNWI